MNLRAIVFSLTLTSSLFSQVQEPLMTEQWYLDAINMQDAWEITTGSSDVVVAIVDAGFDVTHPEYAQNVWRNESEINGVDGVDDDENGYIDDECGYDFFYDRGIKIDEVLWQKTGTVDTAVYHGSMSAGIIGGTHDGVGIAGVNDNVQLINVRVFGPEDEGSASDAKMSKAVQYAVDNGAHIVNMSLNVMFKNDDGIVGMKPIIDDADSVLFVAASGNNYFNMDSYYEENQTPLFLSFPAAYDSPNLISVMMDGRLSEGPFPGTAATVCSDSNTYLTGYYGTERVDLSAPGGAVYSSTVDGEYVAKDGTSYSAPLVSAVAALIKSINMEKATPEVIKQIIMETTKPISELDTMCVSGGTLDAGAALTRAEADFTTIAIVDFNMHAPTTITVAGSILSIDGIKNSTIVEIYSLRGQRVHRALVSAQTGTIKLPNLATGIYTVKAALKNSVHSQAILIQ